MRAAIAEEMGTNSSATATLTDSALLDQFYACKLDAGKSSIIFFKLWKKKVRR
jgi:hypothetical protein